MEAPRPLRPNWLSWLAELGPALLGLSVLVQAFIPGQFLPSRILKELLLKLRN
jgi:hypothetical protein